MTLESSEPAPFPSPAHAVATSPKARAAAAALNGVAETRISEVLFRVSFGVSAEGTGKTLLKK
ncbi:hypothetical protein GCM10028793_32360 [Nocardiopsis oceani]